MLTDAQKAQIRRYLGYSDLYRDGSSALESAMDALSAEAVSVVTDILTQLAALEDALQATWTQAGLQRVEDVVFAGPAGIHHLRQEGRRLVNDLSHILGVPVRGAPFSSGSCGGPALRG